MTPQQIKRNLRRIVGRIDRVEKENRGLSDQILQKLLVSEGLVSLRVLDDNKLIRREIKRTESELSTQAKLDIVQTASFELLPKSIMLPRQEFEGFISFTVTPKKLLDIKTEIGLKLLIASLETQNIVQYISFIDDDFRVVGDSDPFRVGISEKEPEYLDALKSGVSYFFRDSDEDIMKVIHPLDFTSSTRGVLKVAYPITRIDKIYENTFKNTVLNSSVVMVIAIIAAIIAVKLNQRNLRKIESMEKKIRENEKLASLANLTAGVAHEVRNPLNSISITIQRLQLEFAPKSEEDEEEYEVLTDLMKREVDRINHIITDFLDFAKPFEPKKTRFRIDDFLERGITLIAQEIDERGINLITESMTENQTFLGDFEKLIQVFINLVRNAMDASEQHDTITIISRMNRENDWILQIKDNGAGIPKENLNHIFDIYFTTKKNGTGLGLYICRKIVHAHKGSIELLPNTGSGITVSLSLPTLAY